VQLQTLQVARSAGVRMLHRVWCPRSVSLQHDTEQGSAHCWSIIGSAPVRCAQPSGPWSIRALRKAAGESYVPTRLAGHVAPLLVPLVFLVGWIVLVK
jgi:hypothetical protein